MPLRVPQVGLAWPRSIRERVPVVTSASWAGLPGWRLVSGEAGGLLLRGRQVERGPAGNAARVGGEFSGCALGRGWSSARMTLRLRFTCACEMLALG